MSDLLSALVLGIIEGVTEFLPVSSTGHLLIAQHWLGARSDFFNIVIQVGAILAITLVFRQRLWGLATNLGDRDNRDYVAKLAVAHEARGQGLGRRLAELALNRASERGATRVVLLSSSKLGPALKLYESLGFEHRPMPGHQPYETADVYMEREMRTDGRE